MIFFDLQITFVNKLDAYVKIFWLVLLAVMPMSRYVNQRGDQKCRLLKEIALDEHKSIESEIGSDITFECEGYDMSGASIVKCCDTEKISYSYYQHINQNIDHICH